MVSRELPITGMQKVGYDDISQVSFIVEYIKPNYQIDLQEDDWKTRAELVFVFKSDRKLSTGYNEPVHELNFRKFWKKWSPKENPRMRSQLHTDVTLQGRALD